MWLPFYKALSMVMLEQVLFLQDVNSYAHTTPRHTTSANMTFADTTTNLSPATNTHDLCVIHTLFCLD